eukprot:Clim_evm60s128 gene=Clim_evmTU60s128
MGKSSDTAKLSIAQLKQLAESWARKGNLKEEACTLNILGHKYTEKGKMAKALECHRKELMLTQQFKDMDLGIPHRKIAECLATLGEFKEAVHHAKLYVSEEKRRGDDLELQRAWLVIGNIYQECAVADINNRLSGAYLKKALQCLSKSMSIAEVLTPAQGMSGVLRQQTICDLSNNLANVYDLLNKPMEAEWHANEAIDKAQILADDEREMRSYFTKGICMGNQQCTKKAIGAMTVSADLARHRGEYYTEIEALYHLATHYLAQFHQSKVSDVSPLIQTRETLRKAYQKLGRRDDPREMKPQIIKLYRSSGKLEELYVERKSVGSTCELHAWVTGKLYEQIGDIYWDIGWKEKAIEAYESAKTQYQGITGSLATDPVYRVKKHLLGVLGSIGMVAWEISNHDKAIDFYARAAACAEESGQALQKAYYIIDWAQAVEAKSEADQGLDELAAKDILGPVREALQTFMRNAPLPRSQYDQVVEGYRVLGRIYTALAQSKAAEKAHARADEMQTAASEALDDANSQDNDDDEDADFEAEEEILHYSSRRGRHVGDKYVLERNEKGETPLITAAIEGDLERATICISEGAEVNARDYGGWSALHEACNHGNLDIVELLLDHGADINLDGGNNSTPLISAVLGDQLAVVHCLVRRGANLVRRDKGGMRAVDLCKDDDIRRALVRAMSEQGLIREDNASKLLKENNFATTNAYLDETAVKRARMGPNRLLEARSRPTEDILPDNQTFERCVDQWERVLGKRKKAITRMYSDGSDDADEETDPVAISRSAKKPRDDKDRKKMPSMDVISTDVDETSRNRGPMEHKLLGKPASALDLLRAKRQERQRKIAAPSGLSDRDVSREERLNEWKQKRVSFDGKSQGQTPLRPMENLPRATGQATAAIKSKILRGIAQGTCQGLTRDFSETVATSPYNEMIEIIFPDVDKLSLRVQRREIANYATLKAYLAQEIGLGQYLDEISTSNGKTVTNATAAEVSAPEFKGPLECCLRPGHHPEAIYCIFCKLRDLTPNTDVFRQLEQIPSTRAFTLTGIPLSVGQIQGVLAALSHASHCEKLVLDAVMLDEAVMKALARIIPKFSRLRHLSVALNSASAASVHKLIISVASSISSETLEYLDVSGNRLGEISCQKVLTAVFARCTNLRTLKMANCAISDDSRLNLAIMTARSLHNLDISDNDSTLLESKVLMSCIGQSSVRSLIINGYDLTAGNDALEHLSESNSLHSIDIRRCELPSDDDQLSRLLGKFDGALKNINTVHAAHCHIGSKNGFITWLQRYVNVDTERQVFLSIDSGITADDLTSLKVSFEPLRDSDTVRFTRST